MKSSDDCKTEAVSAAVACLLAVLVIQLLIIATKCLLTRVQLVVGSLSGRKTADVTFVPLLWS